MKRTSKRLAALLLACLLLVGLPATLAAAQDGTPDAPVSDPQDDTGTGGDGSGDTVTDSPAQASADFAPCSLTVEHSAVAEDLLSELASAAVVVDVYPVASASPAAHGELDYTLGELYRDLQPDLDAILFPAEGAAAEPVELLLDMARKAALDALAVDAAGSPVQDENGHLFFRSEVVPAASNVTVGQRIPDLAPGLYMVVARGNDSYLRFTKNASGENVVVSSVRGDGHRFLYQPQLVFIPGNENDGRGWIYDVTMQLKPELTSNGSLQIVKTLTDFVADHPGVFVFRIDVYKPDGTRDDMRSTLRSLYFTEQGQQEIVIEDIPAGSRVVVTEEYSGASYTLEGPAAQDGPIVYDEMLELTFTNHGSTGSGGALRNHFHYDDGGWQLDKEYLRE